MAPLSLLLFLYSLSFNAPSYPLTSKLLLPIGILLPLLGVLCPPMANPVFRLGFVDASPLRGVLCPPIARPVPVLGLVESSPLLGVLCPPITIPGDVLVPIFVSFPLLGVLCPPISNPLPVPCDPAPLLGVLCPPISFGDVNDVNTIIIENNPKVKIAFFII